MARRKYLFASRQEAEDKVREIDHMAHQQLRLARALYTGGVQWAKSPQRARIEWVPSTWEAPVGRESSWSSPRPGKSLISRSSTSTARIMPTGSTGSTANTTAVMIKRLHR